MRLISAIAFSLILAGCAASNPIQMTGLSKDQSPFLMSVSVQLWEKNSAKPAYGSFVVYPANIANRQLFRCKTVRGQKEYSLNVSRNGPANQANSFFFSFWVREFPYEGRTYGLWKGYIPSPQRYYAFTELSQYNDEGKPLLAVTVTTHIFENEEAQRMTHESLNEQMTESTIHFGCFLTDK